jgi:DNA-binding response OmpR family regulator
MTDDSATCEHASAAPASASGAVQESHLALRSPPSGRAPSALVRSPPVHRMVTDMPHPAAEPAIGSPPMTTIAPTAPRVLVVEDDESTAEAVAFHLRAGGLTPTLATDGLQALRELRSELPDVVLLDLMLPDVDGWHLIRQTREWAPRLPIIVVTARTNEHDRVEVLSLGADDVMAKPFSMRELMARVQAALRRAAGVGSESAAEPVTEGELTIDPERLTATMGGRPLDLTPLEFTLLWTLAEARSRALSRDEIFRAVWRRERAHGDRSVDVLVRRLRRKVDEVSGAFTYIQTLHGIGYRFLATPRAMPGTLVPSPARPGRGPGITGA